MSPSSAGTAGPPPPCALSDGRYLYRQRRRLTLLGSASVTAPEMSVAPPPPRIAPLSVAASHLAADTSSDLGGDFYVVQHTSHGVRLLIGDVRGKGPHAARSVAGLPAAFRAEAEEVRSLPELSARVEHALQDEQARQAGDEAQEDFVTALLLAIDGAATAVCVINRGHPAPLAVSRSIVELLRSLAKIGTIEVRHGVTCHVVRGRIQLTDAGTRE